MVGMQNTTTKNAVQKLVTTTYESPVGELLIVASDVGLRAVLWPTDTEAEAKPRVKLGDVEAGTNEIIDQTITELDEYFAGSRTGFTIPLDLIGTDLQRETWLALGSIPYGQTTTYGRQAMALGRPTSFRAVANANGKNPVSIVLPCHRVIGANGSLTGFAGGLPAKAWLLKHEERHSQQ